MSLFGLLCAPLEHIRPASFAFPSRHHSHFCCRKGSSKISLAIHFPGLFSAGWKMFPLKVKMRANCCCALADLKRCMQRQFNCFLSKEMAHRAAKLEWAQFHMIQLIQAYTSNCTDGLMLVIRVSFQLDSGLFWSSGTKADSPRNLNFKRLPEVRTKIGKLSVAFGALKCLILTS